MQRIFNDVWDEWLDTGQIRSNPLDETHFGPGCRCPLLEVGGHYGAMGA